MPETTIRTRTENVVKHMETVRLLLRFQEVVQLPDVIEALGLTRAQTICVLQRLEEQGEVFCSAGCWHLREE